MRGAPGNRRVYRDYDRWRNDRAVLALKKDIIKEEFLIGTLRDHLEKESKKSSREKDIKKSKKQKTISKEPKSEEEITEWESYQVEEFAEIKPDTKAYTHGDYSLYKKEIETSGGKKRTIHFFGKQKPDTGEPVPLPDGYEVKVNKKTGLPYLKKKK